MIKNQTIRLFWQPIIHSYFNGETVLPPYLGLNSEQLKHICQSIQYNYPSTFNHQKTQRQLYHDLSTLRENERQNLFSLLKDHLCSQDQYSEAMTIVLSYACLGSQHLWHDIGFPTRSLLTELFTVYYPGLKAMNNNNMRWKRFLYRQMCSAGGDYVCRAPSCEICTSFNECYEQNTVSIELNEKKIF